MIGRARPSPRAARIFTEYEQAEWNNPPVKEPDAAKAANALVRLLFRRMIVLRISYRQLEEKSGISFWTVRSWRTGTQPTIDSLAKTLYVVGYKITATPIDDSTRGGG